MKLIVAVQGASNKGKSNTVKKVREVLIESYNGVEIVLEENGDIQVIVEVVINGIKVRIGLISQGDPNTGLGEKIRNMVSKGCKIIVCSCRTYGETVDSIYEIAELNEYDIVFNSPYISEIENKREFLNKLKAQHIMDLVARYV